MPKQLTNEQLGDLLKQYQTEQKNGLRAFNGRLTKVEHKISDFHDFMIVQLDRQGRKGDTEWRDLLKKALTIIGAALTIMSMLIAAYLQATKR